VDDIPALHELESLVMAAVWDQGEATVRSVTDTVAANADRPRSYTTILTVMIRLDDKGFLERRREGKRDVYVASIDRQTYQRARSATEFDGVVARAMRERRQLLRLELAATVLLTMLVVGVDALRYRLRESRCVRARCRCGISP
jgi:predicted transcriptional regulator